MPRAPDAFGNTQPHLVEFTEFLDDFNKETERGAALAAAALLDDLLKRIIQSFLIPNKGAKDLFEGSNAPLGTFSARTAAAYAMGLLSLGEFEECGLIRKIRNEFAHAVRTSFENPKLAGLCGSLTMAIPSSEAHPINARGKFTSAAVSLILGLTNRAHYVSQKRLCHSDWPR